MKQTIYSSLFLSVASLLFPLKAEDLAERIRRSAIEMTEASQNEDAETLVRYNVLAVSTDGGTTWRFAEVTSIDEKIFRDLFGFFDAGFFGEFYKYTSERCACAPPHP